MERLYFVVDAFTSDQFTGNPAAVVLDTDGLTDQQMQAIAGEFNLSETTFVLKSALPEAAIRFRWFTPTTEVDMCGHASIAAIHALVDSGRIKLEDFPGQMVSIETRSGVLRATVEETGVAGMERLIWLDMPRPSLSKFSMSQDKLARALGLEVESLIDDLPMMKTQENDVIVMVSDFVALNGATPDFGSLERLSAEHMVRGWCVSTLETLTQSVNVQSRFFAPAVGINEDPVTGSVHGPLAMYLATRDLAPIHENMAGLTCLQAKAGGRAGLIRALVALGDDGDCAVRLGGNAVTTMLGQLLNV